MSKPQKTLALWMLLLLIFWTVYQVFSREQDPREPPAFSQLLDQVREGNVDELTINPSGSFEGRLKDGRSFRTTGVLSDYVLQLLEAHEVRFKVTPKTEGGLWQSTLQTWLPMIFLVIIFFLFLRNLQGNSTSFTQMKNATPKASIVEGRSVSFHDVVGAEEAKESAHVLIDALLAIKQKQGTRAPPSVLFHGRPGTGKTLLLDAVASQAGVPVLCMNGAELIEVFVGVGAARLRDLFEKAKKQAPAIVMIDAIDAFARVRGENPLSTGLDEREQTLHQLLSSMTEIAEMRLPIAVVATTSRLDLLDPALTHSGRFGRIVEIPLPSAAETEQLLRQLTKDLDVGRASDLGLLATRATGLAPGQIRAAVDQATVEAKGGPLTSELLGNALDRTARA